VKPVLRDFGPDLGQLQHLVAQRLWVVAPKRVPAAAAPRGLKDFYVVWREEGALLPLVTGLAARRPARRWAWWATLHGGRIRGRRPGGVGGVLIEPLLQSRDVPLLLVDLGPQFGHLGPQRQNQGLGFGRQTAPQVGREWQPIGHSADIAERLACGYVSP
jgi:hypothetical protein